VHDPPGPRAHRHGLTWHDHHHSRPGDLAEQSSKEHLMALPVLTPEQRAEALAKAAEARKARSELLSAVKSGELSIAEVLAKAETDETVKKTKVTALLKALPGVGPVKAAELLEELSIAETRRIGGLGANQRQALIHAAGA
jgi:hypothetical protein